MIDLHQHTTFSDGTDCVNELIRKNKENGIQVMAITDHDSIESVNLTKQFKEKGVVVISGVEFSTDFEGESIHILCYGFDHNDKKIQNLIDEGMRIRHKRIAIRLDILKKEFDIHLDSKMLERIKNSSNPNKPMIANILIDLGYGDNIKEVIDKYLYHKVPDFKLKTVDVIKILAKSSGVCVYAHPLGGAKRVERAEFEKRLKSFVEAGLKGIECYYSLYSKKEQDYLVQIAKKYNLLISGGSDYHGNNKDIKIGELSNYGYRPQKSELTILKYLIKK